MKISPDKINRRQLLLAGCISIVAIPTVIPSLFSKGPNARAKINEIFLTGHKIENNHFISAMTLNGTELFQTPILNQFHSIAACPLTPDSVIGIPRDPNTHAQIISTQTGKITGSLNPGSDRHFNGHGCFSYDGRFFYASENYFSEQQGSIGVYELSTSQRIMTIKSYGQGPHELGFLSDKRTLVVANGGVQTLPESGRKELNTATMRPSLAYIDSKTGKRLQQHELSDHHLSIRHMTIGADDTVGLAMQYKGRVNSPALVGFQRGAEPIKLLKSDSEKTHWQMDNYTASIAIHPKSGIAGVTSPRGDLITFWDSRKHTFLRALGIIDPGGIALSQDGKYFFVTSGTGDLLHIDATTLEIITPRLSPWPEAHWGNHFTQLAV